MGSFDMGSLQNLLNVRAAALRGAAVAPYRSCEEPQPRKPSAFYPKEKCKRQLTNFLRNRTQDPNILDMAQQMAGDPAFRQAQSAMQAGALGSGDLQGVAAQMQAMQGVFNNPAFMQMAQRLGAQMMQARALYPACAADVGMLTLSFRPSGPGYDEHDIPNVGPGVHGEHEDKDGGAEGRPRAGGNHGRV